MDGYRLEILDLKVEGLYYLCREKPDQLCGLLHSWSAPLFWHMHKAGFRMMLLIYKSLCRVINLPVVQTIVSLNRVLQR